jgi:hypothetical protein
MAAVAFVEKNMCGLSATTYATSAVVLVISERAALLLPVVMVSLTRDIA